MNILVVNAGSSSIKYQLFDMESQVVLAKGGVERIGIAGSNLVQKVGDAEAYKSVVPMKDHIMAMKNILEALTDKQHGAIKSMDEIDAVGHRVVHGGETFNGSVLLDDTVMEAIHQNCELAPLHNPANIMGIQACRAVMPKTPMVGVFDTAFHSSIPRRAYLYALPYDFYKRLRIRRYGFHGTSHMYVSQRAAQLLDKPIESLKIVTCHLGNGVSVAAVDGGKSVDTSMGFTPLPGVCMGTRCGDIDPAILEFVMQKEGLSITEMMEILNKQSGLLGLSGLTNDMRDINKGMEEGNERAGAAYEVFCYQIKKYIGAYAAAMGGLDVVVITAGIGENNAQARQDICKGLEFLGLKVDEEKNNRRSGEYAFTTEDSKVTGMVIATNEELVIARETATLLKNH